MLTQYFSHASKFVKIDAGAESVTELLPCHGVSEQKITTSSFLQDVEKMRRFMGRRALSKAS
jgi:hypothetical protein